ncbi:MAG TPA: IPT/TIG domain-containing protein [Bryobacteraceae bacterium]|jgi:uncharacterized protein (TIGR03437 family)
MRIVRIAVAGLLLVSPFTLLRAQPSLVTWHNDSARTGQNLQETTLTPANVNVSTFGKLFVIPVDGKVDAQALYVPSLALPNQGTHNVLFVVTEHDSVYAFDADTGTGLWHVSLLGANETTSDDRNCSQIVPEIGITSTPVIEPLKGPNGTIYAVSMSKDSSGNYHQRLHALNLITGGEEFGGPVEIQATYPGFGQEGSGATQAFDPKQHVERAALTIANGVLYTTWSSHCDITPYTSWVIGYNEATLTQATVLNLTPNGDEGGLWQSGAGPAVDSAGNLYLLMGNGTFDVTLTSGGFPSKGDYGNGFVKISTAVGTATVVDYFTMSNAVAESSADQDLGSGGPLLLPSVNDSQGNAQSLAVGAGKDGNLYVVNRNNMGKFNANANSIYQERASALGPVYSSPAWFNGSMYYGSEGKPLQAFPFTNGQFQAPSSQSSNTFGFPGTTPSISANGNSNGIVWAAENSATAVLHAYAANALSTELYNSNQAPNGRDHFGAGNTFIVPTVVNGKVYVGTTTGVGVFGLLGSATVSISSVTSAAGPVATSIAPGEIVTINGVGLGPAAGIQFAVDPATGMVDSTLGGTRVLFGGVAAPILYASATQVNAIVPYEVAGQSQVAVQIMYEGGTSAAVTVPISTAAPNVFTTSMTGSGQAAALNQDGTLNGPSNPAAKGSYVSLYFSGGGQTSPPGVTGSVNSSVVLKYLLNQPSVMVGGQAAFVGFAGAAPGYVDGLNQLNILLSDNTPSGAQSVVIATGGVSSSPAATISVR